MFECDPATFYNIPTDLLCYLALFLGFPDRVALALTCQGFFNTLTDPRVGSLMLGGLRTRTNAVLALIQYEEWDTLAKVMPRDFEHHKKIITRAIWKGCLPMAIRFRDLIGFRHLGLAIVAGHEHILAHFDLGVASIKRACGFVREYTLTIPDIFLKLIEIHCGELRWSSVGRVLDVALSTREPGALVGLIKTCAGVFGEKKLKRWCYKRALFELGDELFPDTLPGDGWQDDPFITTLGSLALSGRLEAYGKSLTDKGIGKLLEKYGIRYLPYKFIEDNANHVKTSASGVLCVLKGVPHPGRVSRQSVKFQQLVDFYRENGGGGEFLGPLHAKPRALSDVIIRSSRREMVVPGYDWKRHTTHIEILDKHNFSAYTRATSDDKSVLKNTKMLTVMMQVAVDKPNYFRRSPRGVVQAAIAQGRYRELIDQGLGWTLLQWDGNVSKKCAEWIYLQRLETGRFEFANIHVIQKLPIKYLQDALDRWVKNSHNTPEFPWLCGSWGQRNRRLKQLDFSGLEKRLLRKPNRDYINFLFTKPFDNGVIRKVFFDTVVKHRLKTRIIKAARGLTFDYIYRREEHVVKVLRRKTAPYY